MRNVQIVIATLTVFALGFHPVVVKAETLSVSDPLLAEDQALDGVKVTGTDCVPIIPDIGYRPSLMECNGAAAVLMRGAQRNAYSIVVRWVGQFNDRDPHNTGCALASCSPYKTQTKLELPDVQVNCLGDSGFNSSFDGVTRISVKYSAEVSNSLDPHQFQQYCLPNKRISVN